MGKGNWNREASPAHHVPWFEQPHTEVFIPPQEKNDSNLDGHPVDSAPRAVTQEEMESGLLDYVRSESVGLQNSSGSSPYSSAEIDKHTFTHRRVPKKVSTMQPWPVGTDKYVLSVHVSGYSKEKLQRLSELFASGDVRRIFFEQGHEKPWALIRRELSEILRFNGVTKDDSNKFFADMIEPITQDWVTAREAYKRKEMDADQYKQIRLLLKRELARKIGALLDYVDSRADAYEPTVTEGTNGLKVYTNSMGIESTKYEPTVDYNFPLLGITLQGKFTRNRIETEVIPVIKERLISAGESEQRAQEIIDKSLNRVLKEVRPISVVAKNVEIILQSMEKERQQANDRTHASSVLTVGNQATALDTGAGMNQQDKASSADVARHVNGTSVKDLLRQHLNDFSDGQSRVLPTATVAPSGEKKVGWWAKTGSKRDNPLGVTTPPTGSVDTATVAHETIDTPGSNTEDMVTPAALEDTSWQTEFLDWQDADTSLGLVTEKLQQTGSEPAHQLGAHNPKRLFVRNITAPTVLPVLSPDEPMLHAEQDSHAQMFRAHSALKNSEESYKEWRSEAGLSHIDALKQNPEYNLLFRKKVRLQRHINKLQKELLTEELELQNEPPTEELELRIKELRDELDAASKAFADVLGQRGDGGGGIPPTESSAGEKNAAETISPDTVKVDDEYLANIDGTWRKVRVYLKTDDNLFAVSYIDNGKEKTYTLGAESLRASSEDSNKLPREQRVSQTGALEEDSLRKNKPTAETFSVRDQIRTEWRDYSVKEKQYESALEAFVKSEKERKDARSTLGALKEKLFSWGENKPESLTRLEREYLTARERYAEVLSGSFEKSTLGKHLVGRPVDHRIEIEKRFLSPKQSALMQSLQGVFSEHRGTVKKFGLLAVFASGSVFGIARTGASVLRDYMSSDPSLATSMYAQFAHGALSSISSLSASTAGAVGGTYVGGALGDWRINKADKRRAVSKINAKKLFRLGAIEKLEADFYNDTKRYEKTLRDKKKFVAAGAVLGGTLGSLVNGSFEDMTEVFDTAQNGPVRYDPLSSIVAPTVSPETPVPGGSGAGESPAGVEPLGAGTGGEIAGPVVSGVDSYDPLSSITPPTPEPETLVSTSTGESSGSSNTSSSETRTQPAYEDVRGLEYTFIPGDKINTVSEALGALVEKNPTLITGDMTPGEAVREFNHQIDHLKQDNPDYYYDLLDQMGVTSGDIDEVGAGKTYNFAPLFEYMNSLQQ